LQKPTWRRPRKQSEKRGKNVESQKEKKKLPIEKNQQIQSEKQQSGHEKCKGSQREVWGKKATNANRQARRSWEGTGGTNRIRPIMGEGGFP